MTLPASFLDELRARTLLSSLVQRDVPLRRAGNEHKACCPFHDEKSPSFYVNDAKGFYHCFGCGAHGDAIRWLTDKRGLPFIEAVRELAEAAGMQMPARTERDAIQDERLERARAVMARAATLYSAELRSFGGEAAQQYLRDRGIDPGFAAEFDLGFARRVRKGQRSDFAEALKDVSDELLVELGLMKRAEDRDDMYDFFRGRVMIPIHDARGRVIAFGGRLIADGEPKYLNSPDTPLFDKGRTLFNLHRAAPAARRAGRLVIVEGYMDVLAMARAGIAESVAPNGTAVTVAQLNLAWRHTAVPLLCFDGDTAGRKAAARAALLALPEIEPGKSLAFVFPADGKDPDDILREQGATAVADMLANPRSLVDIIWQYELEATDLSSPEARAGMIHRIEGHCKRVKAGALARELWREFSALYEARLLRSQRAKAPIQPGRTDLTLPVALEAAIAVGLSRHPAVLRARVEEVAGKVWAATRCRSIIDQLIAIVISGADDMPVALAGAGLGDAIRELRQMAVVPFSFVSGEVTEFTEAELVDALERMPSK